MLQAVEAHMVRSRGLRIVQVGSNLTTNVGSSNSGSARRAKRTGDEQALTAREEKTYEKLIEVGAGLEPGRLKRERKNANRLAEVRHVARDALKVTPAKQAKGAFHAEVGRMQMNEGGPCMSAESAGMLLLITAALLSGEAPGATFKRGDDGLASLQWRPGYVFGRADGMNAPQLQRTLEHLQRNQWLSLSWRDETRWVTFGPRAIRVLDLKGAK
jgi:hypothetical protein